MTQHIPKAELHVHLEGTLSPEMAQELATRNNVPLPDDLFDADGNYTWPDDGTGASALLGFVHAYDKACAGIQTEQDYFDITYDYLIRSAAQGVIYTEMTISVDHPEHAGIPYSDFTKTLAKAAIRAKAETGIECRFICACVRHYGPENATRVAQIVADNPHPLVTGFTMAGDENAHDVADFVPAYEIAKAAGLKVTAHAGEAAGPESIRKVRDLLGCTRFGHMVRITEDPELMAEMAASDTTPEVCVSSNLVLKVYPDHESHPIKQLWDAGFKVTLGSDDPPFFFTDIGREYQIAQDVYGFSDDDLRQMTRNALNAAFIDQTTLDNLMEKI